MQNYQINEGHFDLPSQWQDQSLNIFRIPATEQAQEASLIISREAALVSQRFDDFVHQQLHHCEQQLPGFKLLQRQICVEPFSYAWVDYTWQGQEKQARTVLMRQIFFESKPCHLIVSLTTTPEDAPHHEAAWRAMIRSVQLKNFVVAGVLTPLFGT